jgi:hypothetical protein
MGDQRMTAPVTKAEITGETEAAVDAAWELVEMHARVCARPGAAFRDLRRRIEAYVERVMSDGVDPGDVPIRIVGNTMMAQAPHALTALLVEARALLGEQK